MKYIDIYNMVKKSYEIPQVVDDPPRNNKVQNDQPLQNYNSISPRQLHVSPATSEQARRYDNQARINRDPHAAYKQDLSNRRQAQSDRIARLRQWHSNYNRRAQQLRNKRLLEQKRTSVLTPEQQYNRYHTVNDYYTTQQRSSNPYTQNQEQKRLRRQQAIRSGRQRIRRARQSQIRSNQLRNRQVLSRYRNNANRIASTPPSWNSSSGAFSRRSFR